MSIGPVLFPERLPNLVASGIVIIYSFTQRPYTDLFPIFWEATMEKSISLLKLIWVEIYDEVYSWELWKMVSHVYFQMVGVSATIDKGKGFWE